MSIQVLTGQAIAPHMETVAELRMRVFRDWPYLYAGSVEYEREYLAHYQAATGSVFVLALSDADDIVGCSTGLPMINAQEEFRQPFIDAGYDLERVFYFGESVLDPAWRGRGIGHAFFDEREAHARRSGHDITTFCAVVRPDDHPRRPIDYRPLDGFWKKRGYAPVEKLTTRFAWRDLDAKRESDKLMQFWVKREPLRIETSGYQAESRRFADLKFEKRLI